MLPVSFFFTNQPKIKKRSQRTLGDIHSNIHIKHCVKTLNSSSQNKYTNTFSKEAAGALIKLGKNMTE